MFRRCILNKKSLHSESVFIDRMTRKLMRYVQFLTKEFHVLKATAMMLFTVVSWHYDLPANFYANACLKLLKIQHCDFVCT